MTVAICHYIQFKSAQGSPISGYAFQNFFIGETKLRTSINYLFAPFATSTGAGTKGGDRSDAALVAPVYPLTASLFVEACQQRWLLEIISVLLDPETYDEVMTITSETWMCAKPELDTERAVLRLSSPLDAVDGQVPRRVVSSALVGSVPTTGALSTR